MGDQGIVGFVTNAGFVDGATTAGLRKCLADEYAKIYVFHLRGNQRTSGEQSRREGGKVFGSGSRAPIAISLFVKDTSRATQGEILFCDIGDYLSREEKLLKISEFASVGGIAKQSGWTRIEPDDHGDWLRQRDGAFDKFMVMGDKKNTAATAIFTNYSCGVKSQRDAWCFNASRRTVETSMQSMIAFYNAEASSFSDRFGRLSRQDRVSEADNHLNADATSISWTRALRNDAIRGRQHKFDATRLTVSVYRPFTKQWLYFDRAMNEMVYQMNRIFPNSEAKNRVIMFKQRWSGEGQLALMVDCIPELQTDGGTQCFPLWLYEDAEGGLFPGSAGRCDAISAEALAYFEGKYPGETVTAEDLFYYIYGVLHSAEYLGTFADNLSKDIPRIPAVRAVADFWAFSKAGRDLADMHVGYEGVTPFSAIVEVRHKAVMPADRRGRSKALPLAQAVEPLLAADVYAGGSSCSHAFTPLRSLTPDVLRVKKMRFARIRRDGKSVPDRTTIEYNEHIIVKGIPEEAYDYVVNGKSAIDWVMERQAVKTHKSSGIVNDANTWAIETVHNPRYSLELLLRVITVSLETLKIVRSLPALDL